MIKIILSILGSFYAARYIKSIWFALPLAIILAVISNIVVTMILVQLSSVVDSETAIYAMIAGLIWYPAIAIIAFIIFRIGKKKKAVEPVTNEVNGKDKSGKDKYGVAFVSPKGTSTQKYDNSSSGQQDKSKYNFCIQCGVKSNSGDEFCGNCGTKTGEENKHNDETEAGTKKTSGTADSYVPPAKYTETAKPKSIDPFPKKSTNFTPYKETSTAGDGIGGSTFSVFKGLGIGALVLAGCLFGTIGLMLFLFNVFVLDNNESDPQRNLTSQNDQRENSPSPTLTNESYYYVTAIRANLLNKPSSDGYILTELDKFDKIKIYQITNGWAEVERDGRLGWIEEKYIAPREGRVLFDVDNTIAKETLKYGPEVVRLHGTLVRRTGKSPNEEEITYPAIKLKSPVRVVVDSKAYPKDVDITDYDVDNVSLMQLVLDGKEWQQYKRLKGHQVIITGTLYSAHTGHHHTNVLVNVEDIEEYAENVKKYCNTRYEFCFNYPAGFRVEPPPANGDGRIFYKDDGFKMTVFGSNDVSRTAEDAAKSYAEGLTAMTYKQSGKNWYALSGYKGESVLYVKVFSGKISSNNIIIEYPRWTKNENDQLVSVIVKSFKPGNTDIYY